MLAPESSRTLYASVIALRHSFSLVNAPIETRFAASLFFAEHTLHAALSTRIPNHSVNSLANYSYTHSLLFTTDPFTQTGALATIKLNQRWLVQAGIQASNDTAPWADDAKPSLTACLSYTTASVNDNVYVCANGINDGRYGYNNVQHYDATWYHKFSSTTHIATEAWYMYERDVPNISGPVTPKPGANPAFCSPGEIRCFAPEWSVANYVERELSKKDYLSIRNEYLDDIKGQRTGFKSRYSEHELMYGHWIGSTLVFRPGIRFDRSYDRPAYDAGTRQSQFSFTMDVIFKF